jgi:hypothetical protein
VVLMLEKAGHAIDVVEDGAAAIEAVRAGPVQPGADGRADALVDLAGDLSRRGRALHDRVDPDARFG